MNSIFNMCGTKIYKPTDKMSDLICENYALLQVLSRFGVSLGFGDKSVQEVCSMNGVDCTTFLAVVNFLTEENNRMQDHVTGLSVPALMDYLQRAHSYFLDFQLPTIRRKLIKAIDFNCDGYILKDSDFDTLKNAIMTVYEGQTYIEPTLVPLLNVRLAERDLMKDKSKELTRREVEVLKMIASGSSNKEIASTLSISERTVKNHVSNIFKKIDVSDRTQAAVFAIKNDIIKLK